MRLHLPIVVALLASAAFGVQPALACYDSGAFFVAKNLTDFKVGQHSQGGNFY